MRTSLNFLEAFFRDARHPTTTLLSHRTKRMKRKRPTIDIQPRRTLSRVEGIALVAAACAVSGAEAQENAAAAAEEASTTLPPEEVKAATPAPKPAPKPAPQRPAPAPVPQPVIEPEPLVFDDSLYQVKTLSTTKYSVPLRDVPQTVQVVPEELIKEQGAMTLRDVLRNVPGVTMSAGEGGGGVQGDSFRLRGFGSRSDIFVDGVRDFGVRNRDPFNIEAVEVFKGPSSQNNGRGSAGGSLNLVTKTPKLDSFTRADATVGTDDLYRFTLDYNAPIIRHEGGTSGKSGYGGKSDYGKSGYDSGKGVLLDDYGSAFRLNLLYHDGDTPGRDVVGQNRWGVAPSVAFGLGTDTRLTLSYLHMEEDNTPDYGLPFVPAGVVGGPHPGPGVPVGVRFSNYYGIVGLDYEDITTDMVSAIFEHDFNDNVRLRNVTRYTYNELESLVAAPRFSPVAAGQTNIVSNHPGKLQEYQAFSNTTELTIEFDTGGLRHTAVAGMEFISEQQDNGWVRVAGGPDPGTNLYNPNPWRPHGMTVLVTPYQPGVAPTNNLYRATMDTRSAYFFDTIEITDSLKYIGGLRYDHVEMVSNQVGAAGRRVDEFVTWRSALVYNPAENGSVYFGYGTSIAPSGDSVNGLTFSTRDELNNTINLLNVDPEEAQSFELGTKWDILDERLSLSGALFRTEKTNARIVDPTAAGGVSVNGEQVVQGFELGAVGNVTDSWRIFAGYVYTDTEITADNPAAPGNIGKRLGNSPLNTFNLWSVHDLPGGFQFGIGTQFVDERTNNPTNEYYLADYWLVDAMLSYKVSESLTLRLNATNLLDKEYVDRAGGGHFVPGMGRQVSFTASMEF